MATAIFPCIFIPPSIVEPLLVKLGCFPLAGIGLASPWQEKRWLPPVRGLGASGDSKLHSFETLSLTKEAQTVTGLHQ